MATMKDVAELAGVSTATVSHVVNGTKRLSPETTERVLLAIEQVKYNPNTAAKSLRSGQSNTVGVLVEDIRGLPVPQIVSGIEEILTRSGYRMLLYDLHLLEKVFNQYDQINTYHARVNNAIALLLASNADGIIFVGIHDRRIKSLFDPIDKPLVIAYNAQFDLMFLYYLLNQYGDVRLLKDQPKLDLLTVYKDRYSYPHKLCNAIESYGLSHQVVNSHRAIDDVRATVAVMRKMAEERADMEKYIDLFGYNAKYGVSGKRISSVRYIPQGFEPGIPLHEKEVLL